MAVPDDPVDETRGLLGLAHALGNLAQVMSGNLDLLDAHVTDEPARRYLAHARAAAEQLGELSRRLSANACD